MVSFFISFGYSIRKAMVIPAIGIATLVVVPTVAQTTAPADSAKATTIDRNNEVKPVVFAKETFTLYNFADEVPRDLTLYVMNTKGDKFGFDAIMGQLHNSKTDTKVNGLVIAFIDKPDEYITKFLFADMERSKVLATVSDADALAWVKKFVTNLKYNKSDIVVDTAKSATAKAVPK
jgi:hypothetical protein